MKEREEKADGGGGNLSLSFKPWTDSLTTLDLGCYKQHLGAHVMERVQTSVWGATALPLGMYFYRTSFPYGLDMNLAIMEPSTCSTVLTLSYQDCEFLNQVWL